MPRHAVSHTCTHRPTHTVTLLVTLTHPHTHIHNHTRSHPVTHPNSHADTHAHTHTLSLTPPVESLLVPRPDPTTSRCSGLLSTSHIQQVRSGEIPLHLSTPGIHKSQKLCRPHLRYLGLRQAPMELPRHRQWGGVQTNLAVESDPPHSGPLGWSLDLSRAFPHL